MMKLKIIMQPSAEDLEREVGIFLKGKKLFNCNFQKNVFYQRKENDFTNTLLETYTAFIVHED